MSDLTDVRNRLAQIVADGVKDFGPDPELGTNRVFTYFPQVVTGPFAMVGPGNPYIEYDGTAFGTRRVRNAVTVVVATGTNDVMAATLDEYIDAVSEAVDASGQFAVVQVDQPGSVTPGGQTRLAASIQCMTEV